MGNGVDTVVEALENSLGINDPEQNISKEEEIEGASTAEEKKTEETTEQSPHATVITTEEQNDTLKDILKIDIEIKKLEAQTVDISTFYDNLEAELTEQEQELEFSDKTAYMKLVSQKAKEYEVKHSPTAAIAQLKASKEELVSIRDRQVAILATATKYPDFNYEKVFEFFDKKLTKEQQDAIYESSKSYSDVYEKAYVEYAKSNKTNIHQENPPKLPNVNNVRKQPIDNHTIEDGLSTDEQRLQDALGI